MMNDFLGRITGRKIGEIYFRLPYSTRIDLGDLALADDTETGIKFYLRVVDISYGAEGADLGWFERTAGNLMLLDESENEYGLFERERRLYKIARCNLLGYSRDNKFFKPKTIPSHFTRVRRPYGKDFAFLKNLGANLMFSRLRSGESVLDFEIGLSSKSVASHIGIFATTGMGKSNLMKRFAGSILENGNVGLLIFDPHGEYFDGGGEAYLKGLINHAMADKNLRIYSSRPLEKRHEKLQISSSEIVPEDLNHIYEFSEAQHEALSALFYRFGKSWLSELRASDISELSQRITTQGGFAESTLGVLKRRAENLLKQNYIHTDSEVSTSRNIIEKLKDGKVVLIDSSNLTTRDELLIGSVLCRAVFHHYRSLYSRPDDFRYATPILVAIEEAQRVLRKSSGGYANIFSRIAREGRKFKIGLCAITQQPKLIDEELLSQFNTFLILGLADESDRQIIRSSSKQDISDLGNEIQMLSAGEALITSPEVPFALPVKIDLYEEYLKKAETLDIKDKSRKTSVDEEFF
ncbi:MAG: ATP-binding protein [candidate division Zixibacteria bacterium]|nr:ATP-binding protein [candidate division Zixibacteria bacterium]NIR63698.1 ATP-binding protein [candidate division Zixibacteria bacterium]NIS14655.1 ATP-binding protein [candidate division Zixibacteria bacterium]NIS45654.1 ATP-binding protein [candidate division Zixibacteria bacterium]NIT51183.1 ATP-binding protein [candidate division Zixibacteria bacterium]